MSDRNVTITLISDVMLGKGKLIYFSWSSQAIWVQVPSIFHMTIRVTHNNAWLHRLPVTYI